MDPLHRCPTHRFASLRASLTALLLAGAVSASHAAIPPGERVALQAFYTSTGGATWTDSTGWNGAAGTECTWHGVSCSAGDANVVGIVLNTNQLTGTLPTLDGFAALERLSLTSNEIGGTIPPLTGLPSLQLISLLNNQFTGSIPSLTGLSSLTVFDVGDNQLTGPLPSLAGLAALEEFSAEVNELTGPIPSLTGLASLRTVQLYNNQLSGTIPALAGLTALSTFWVFDNQLSGTIPPLVGLVNLDEFDVSTNQLTGSIPSLLDLVDLDSFSVRYNQLSGAVPQAPPNLDAGASTLCPNLLTPSVDPAWDAATGQTPWSFLCGGSGTSFTVTPSVSGNGTITPGTPQSVVSGMTIAFLLAPGAGSAIDTVAGTCGGTLNGTDYTTNAILGDCTVVASFVPVAATVTVTPGAGPNGTITPSTPQSVASGSVVVFDVVPDSGYVIAGVGGSCGGALVATTYTTQPIVQDCTVNASFALTPGAGGAIAAPTLSEWSLLLLAFAAAALGVARMRSVRRQPHSDRGTRGR